MIEKEVAREVVIRYARAGKLAPTYMYKIAKMTPRDADLAAQLESMREDPVEHFAKIRKDTEKKVRRQMWLDLWHSITRRKKW